jgi:hypothetical protein
MKLIILITSNIENGLEVANRWQDAGAPGVTIIKSVGLYSLQEKIKQGSMEVPLHIASSMASMMAYMLGEMEHTNHVLLSVVPKDMIPELLNQARDVMGDLLKPDNGVAFVVPLDEAIGVRLHSNDDTKT